MGGVTDVNARAPPSLVANGRELSPGHASPVPGKALRPPRRSL